MKLIKTMIVIGANASPEVLKHAELIAKSLGLVSDRLPRSKDYAHYARWDGNILRSDYGTGFDVSFNQAVVKDMDVIIDLRQYKARPVSLKLNDSYDAEIINDGATVKVGCQEFPASKVLELAKLIKGK